MLVPCHSGSTSPWRTTHAFVALADRQWNVVFASMGQTTHCIHAHDPSGRRRSSSPPHTSTKQATRDRCPSSEQRRRRAAYWTTMRTHALGLILCKRCSNGPYHEGSPLLTSGLLPTAAAARHSGTRCTHPSRSRVPRWDLRPCFTCITTTLRPSELCSASQERSSNVAQKASRNLPRLTSGAGIETNSLIGNTDKKTCGHARVNVVEREEQVQHAHHCCGMYSK